MFDYRYIYLMERTSKSSAHAKLTFQEEIKIGIAKNPNWRRKDIDDDLPGNVRIILAKKILFARFFEKYLHRLFADSRFTIKGGPNSGRTEWFYCSPMERLFLEGWVYWFSIRPFILYPFRCAVVVLFIYLFMQNI